MLRFKCIEIYYIQYWNLELFFARFRANSCEFSRNRRDEKRIRGSDFARNRTISPKKARFRALSREKHFAKKYRKNPEF